MTPFRNVQEIKLIILVFILVVAPAVAVSFFAGRVLGSWQIVLQKRMETDAVRVLDQAVAVWEKQLGQIRENISSNQTSVFPSCLALPLAHSWIEGAFVVQPGVGLLYPPSESTNSSFAPSETSAQLLIGAVSTNPAIEIQECKRALQRPGLDPVLGAATLLRLAKACQMTGATNESVITLKQVAGIGSHLNGETLFLRDPDEGFYYDLIALKELADLLDAQGDRAGVQEMKAQLLQRVLARYDDLVPLQREVLVEWISSAASESSSLTAAWRERMRGRGLTSEDRAKLALDAGSFLPSLSEKAWIRARIAGREMLVAKIRPSQILAVEFNEPRLISHLDTVFSGVAGNTGVRIACRRDETKTSELLAEPALLSARRLPPPFGSITVEAYPGDPRTFLANARLQTRLYRWGGLLLLISMVAGAWLIWRQAAGEIRQARESSDFAATVSHDLRTPLASMRMLAESLYMGSVGDEAKKQKFLGAIIKESDRLSRLTDRALYFIRYGQGALRYQFTEGDVGVVVKDVVETVAVGMGGVVEFGPGNVTTRQPNNQPLFRLDLAPGVPPVRFDGGAMEQVVFNLLDNAVKYSRKEEGVIIEVALSSEGRNVKLAVTDHGIGMTSEDMRRVLKPYARGSGSAQHHAKGVGLGLALCQHVVKAHGGKIWIESRPGKGSTFSIILPAVM